MNYKCVILVVALMAVLSGCKPREVKLFEQGVLMYSDLKQREQAVQLLRQSGDLGCAKAYYFLSDKELSEARGLLKFKPEYSFVAKDSRMSAAIDACNRSLEYLTMAQSSDAEEASCRIEVVEKMINEIVR